LGMRFTRRVDSLQQLTKQQHYTMVIEKIKRFFGGGRRRRE